MHAQSWPWLQIFYMDTFLELLLMTLREAFGLQLARPFALFLLLGAAHGGPQGKPSG